MDWHDNVHWSMFCCESVTYLRCFCAAEPSPLPKKWPDSTGKWYAFCWSCRPIYVPWNACSIEFHVYPLHVNGNEQAATAISLVQAIDHPLLQRRQAPDDVDECCADFVTRCVGAFRNGKIKENRAVRLRPFEAEGNVDE